MSRKLMATVYVTEQGAVLRKTGERLRVTLKSEVLLDLPLIKVSQVVIFGKASITAATVAILLEHDIESHVKAMHTHIMKYLRQWQQQFPELIADIRGQGLLIALELSDPAIASKIYVQSRENGLLLNLKHGTILRLFPALTITQAEIEEGLQILQTVMGKNYTNEE